MLRKILLRLKARHLEALQEQKGQSIIIFTFAVIGLIAMLGLALDLGLVYIEKVKINRTTDATALASVVELPYEQDTINRAIEYIRLNGYDVGVDTEILVRGCIISPTTYVDSQGVSHIYTRPGGVGNKAESAALPITTTTLITGARYISATQSPVRATFVVDTGAYQSGNPANPDTYCASDNLGTASKVRVAGRVWIPMNFMQFFGFSRVPVQDESTAENLTSLDVMIVFDISGSMEDQTICHDCWVRTSYNPNWPNNGYFNPLPYNPAWATGSTDNQSIAQSGLCTVYPPQPHVQDGFRYLTVEAELYSRNASNWGLDVRTPGNGFFSIQRASKATGNNALGEDNEHNRQAGNPAEQSSNVCRPNILGAGSQGIDCTVGLAGNPGDNVCSSTDGGYAVDCSAYIAARPMTTYGQQPGNIPNLNGAAYNGNCFAGNALSGSCWSNNPFNTLTGLEVGPNSVPWVEYDFTPTWTGNTYIWMRVIGGGEEAYTWAGSSPDQIQPDLNGGGTGNNITPWRKVIYWQVDNGTIYERKDNVNNDYSWTPDEENVNTVNANYQVQRVATWRTSRAENDLWRWIRLNDDDGAVRTINVTNGSQYTLKLYQGSAGYMVDKIVFTNDNRFPTPERGGPTTNIPNALKRDVGGNTTNTPGDMLGPPASLGSATREACNKCNPAYGFAVNPADCACKRTPSSANDFINGGCTTVLSTTNQLQAQVQSGLYSDHQPLRSAQEAVKNFARRLDPKFDQLGIVAFTGGGDNTSVMGDGTRRSKLMCLRWATERFGNPARCYDATLNPITYSLVISAVEKHWSEGGTNISIGMREGLEDLGVPGFAANSDCTTATNTSSATGASACDRRGAARRIIILMTDGSPNENPGSCTPGGGRPDMWNGLLGTSDPDFECAAYYGWLAAQNNVTVYTIGIGAGANGDLLTLMATGIDPHGDEPDIPMFGGASGRYFNAAKPTDLDLIFEQILSNIYVRIVS